MLKRYRQLRGQVLYLRKHGVDASSLIHELECASVALATVIVSIEPEVDLKSERAIAFQPERPFPRAALNRAIFTAIRSSRSGIDHVQLFSKMMEAKPFKFSSAYEADHFAARFDATLKRLLASGAIQIEGALLTIKQG